MAQWWNYRPADLLLFSPRVYWRMFELQNAQMWPLALLTLSAGFAMVFLVIWRPKDHGRWIAIILALLWAIIGYSFVWNRYATINWAMAYVAPMFALQSILLLIVGIASDGLVFTQRGFAGWSGLVLIASALLLYPVLPVFSGTPWRQMQLFGMAPDPTAIGTLGLLVLARGRYLALLFPIPVLWCFITALTLSAMGSGQAWLALAAVAVVLTTGVRLALLRRSPPNAG
jgi:hypothetical protein